MNNFENCGYYVDEECTICGMGTDGEDTFCKYCKDNPNCYYKQLLKFKIENEWLKALCDTYRTCYQAKHGDIKGLLFKYKQTLQDIKAIAEKPKPFKDFSEIKTATEVEYDYAAICNELELRLHKVLELITKAESEDNQ